MTEEHFNHIVQVFNLAPTNKYHKAFANICLEKLVVSIEMYSDVNCAIDQPDFPLYYLFAPVPRNIASEVIRYVKDTEMLFV